MKAISFILSGKTACFRKPDVNQFAYFTYNNIHKPALLGLFGAIIGLGGYTQLNDENIRNKKDKKSLNSGFPEFYEKLQHLKISIIPLVPNGYFSKKIQNFNNGVGYANAFGAKPEERISSYNLQVREQWLENPIWQIMILDDGSSEYEKIKEYLENGKAVFIPYLGKNDHFADIKEVKSIELESPILEDRIYSIFMEKDLKLSKIKPRAENSCFFKEIAPIRLNKQYHFYEFENLIFTNHSIIEGDYLNIYSVNEKNYAFI
ncbi:type I-B CRISPR-associated protein Cas5b [Aliarcobacter vitoriensis]|uniref:type I-B CRISPR-associated protein Cas5b n=1 Tax=Aliarcobacter vitoriensis TaxID=2011099 RepID=UPI003AAC397F